MYSTKNYNMKMLFEAYYNNISHIIYDRFVSFALNVLKTRLTAGNNFYLFFFDYIFRNSPL